MHTPVAVDTIIIGKHSLSLALSLPVIPNIVTFEWSGTLAHPLSGDGYVNETSPTTGLFDFCTYSYSLEVFLPCFSDRELLTLNEAVKIQFTFNGQIRER